MREAVVLGTTSARSNKGLLITMSRSSVINAINMRQLKAATDWLLGGKTAHDSKAKPSTNTALTTYMAAAHESGAGRSES